MMHRLSKMTSNNVITGSSSPLSGHTVCSSTPNGYATGNDEFLWYLVPQSEEWEVIDFEGVQKHLEDQLEDDEEYNNTDYEADIFGVFSHLHFNSIKPLQQNTYFEPPSWTSRITTHQLNKKCYQKYNSKTLACSQPRFRHQLKWKIFPISVDW